jgi:hypothetical protein
MLMFVGGWGMLMLVDPFKEKGRSFYGILSFLLAVMVVLSRKAVSVILVATPWLMLLILIAFFFLFFAKMLGGPGVQIPIGEGKVYGWLIFFVAVIILFAIGNSFGQDLLNAQVPEQPATISPVPVIAENGTVIGTATPQFDTVASNDFGKNLTLTLFHPKILGILFLFLLGTLTILLLNQGS